MSAPDDLKPQQVSDDVFSKVYTPYLQQAIFRENVADVNGHMRTMEAVKQLERKIDLIFGDHILIKGRWVSLSALKGCV